ncbi:MAG: hypothetical protein LBR84_09335 [Tannerella sp.]|nr:hypothetical protein [Tannerella sp.]
MLDRRNNIIITAVGGAGSRLSESRLRAFGGSSGRCVASSGFTPPPPQKRL